MIMNVIILKDMSLDMVDAVIVSEQTTREDIQKIIDKTRSRNVYDVEKELPNDCQIVDRWNVKWNEVWY